MGLPDDCNENSCDSQIGENHRGICPAGSHIPSYYDWFVLKIYVESTGTKLKTKSDWIENNGTDDYGFSALPGGFYGFVTDNEGTRYAFGQVGYYGYWWTATNSDEQEFAAHAFTMAYNSEYATENTYSKTSMYSVRCVKD